MIIVNEENYNRVIKENQTIKQDNKEIRERMQKNANSINGKQVPGSSTSITDKELLNNSLYKGVKTNLNFGNLSQSYDIGGYNKNKLDNSMRGYNITSTYEDKIGGLNNTNKMEYLKNVLIKYLEATAIGDQFQIKMLENVMFSVLGVSKQEKRILDEKRLKSSFYYNIWYNAKNYISSKIYGTTTSYDDSFTPSSTRSNRLELDYNETKLSTESKGSKEKGEKSINDITFGEEGGFNNNSNSMNESSNQNQNILTSLNSNHKN